MILVVYILSASQLITEIRRGDELSSCEKEQRGVNSVNKYWTTGTVLEKIRPGRVNTGMGKQGDYPQ